MFRLLLRIGVLTVMVLAFAIPNAEARPIAASDTDLTANAASNRVLLETRRPKERRSLIEVATSGLFDIFGFEVGASASYDPLCEFVNPLLDVENKLNCGVDYA